MHLFSLLTRLQGDGMAISPLPEDAEKLPDRIVAGNE
jgi:hypothetical protein